MVEIGVDLSEFYMSVEWDILEVPAVRQVPSASGRAFYPIVDIQSTTHSQRMIAKY